MTTIIRATSPADFLSLIPTMLGYTPSRSVVLMPFARSRSIGAMRFDLPEEGQIDSIAATSIGMICRLDDADAVAAVVYTDEEASGAVLPHDEFVRAFAVRADACGLELRDALCVASDAWGSYLDAHHPPRLHDLSELAPDPIIGGPAPGDQYAGCELPTVDESEIEQVAQALAGVDAAVHTLCGEPARATRPEPPASPEPHKGRKGRGAGRVDPRALAAACRLDDVTALFEEAVGLDASCLDPFTAALVIWALDRPSSRDIALMQWSADEAAGDVALQAHLRWEQGEDYPADLGERMWGEGPRPDPNRLTAALNLCRHAAARAPEERRAGALAACGWLSWALGLSTHAEQYALQACALEPEHGLGEIVRSFTAMGHLPAWAFAAVHSSERRPSGARERAGASARSQAI